MIDQITFLEPGVEIRAETSLAADTEYLRDHFPRFPVMPGVLMLEALFQAAMWLVRVTDDFQHSLVLLKAARNVKFAGFVQPGQVLDITCTLKKIEDNVATVQARGVVEGATAVGGRLTLQLSDLRDEDPLHGPRDVFAIAELRHELHRLRQVAPSQSTQSEAAQSQSTPQQPAPISN